MCTHPIEHYQVLHDSASCLSRAATVPKGTKLELGRGAHLGTPSSVNHTAAASQPTGRIAKAASWLHLSRVSPALHPTERPSHTHTPKPGFGGRGLEDILNKENVFPLFPSRLRIWSHEIGSVVLPASACSILQTQPESGANSRDFSCFPRRRPFIPPTAIDRISPEFVGSRN